MSDPTSTSKQQKSTDAYYQIWLDNLGPIYKRPCTHILASVVYFVLLALITPDTLPGVGTNVVGTLLLSMFSAYLFKRLAERDVALMRTSHYERRYLPSVMMKVYLMTCIAYVAPIVWLLHSGNGWVLTGGVIVSMLVSTFVMKKEAESFGIWADEYRASTLHKRKRGYSRSGLCLD